MVLMIREVNIFDAEFLDMEVSEVEAWQSGKMDMVGMGGGLVQH
jgi:hypothetical protein